MLGTTHDTFNTIDATSSELIGQAFGLADRSGVNGSVGWTSEDNVNPSNTSSIFSSSSALLTPTTSGGTQTTLYEVGSVTFRGNKVDLNFTTVDSTARCYGLVTFNQTLKKSGVKGPSLKGKSAKPKEEIGNYETDKSKEEWDKFSVSSKNVADNSRGKIPVRQRVLIRPRRDD